MAKAASRPKQPKTLKLVLKGLLVFVGLISTLIVGAFTYNTFSNYQDKHRISNEYRAITWPSVMQLKSAHFVGTSFIKGMSATGIGWNYDYTIDHSYSMQQAHDLMVRTLEKEGFSVDHYMVPSANGLSGHNAKITVFVIINAVNDSNDPSKPVDFMGVSVYER